MTIEYRSTPTRGGERNVSPRSTHCPIFAGVPGPASQRTRRGPVPQLHGSCPTKLACARWRPQVREGFTPVRPLSAARPDRMGRSTPSVQHHRPVRIDRCRAQSCAPEVGSSTFSGTASEASGGRCLRPHRGAHPLAKGVRETGKARFFRPPLPLGESGGVGAEPPRFSNDSRCASNSERPSIGGCIQ